MKREYLKSAGGLWYALDRPTIKHELNTTLFACIGGSGETGSYAASDMPSEIDRVINKNGFGQDAANGQELPFWVISPLATKGKDIADHSLIMKELSNVVKFHKQDYAFLAGLSQGGQSVAGYVFQSRNGTEISKGLESAYKNPKIYDGAIIMCGKIPGTPDVNANPEIPLLIIHATGDGAVSISNGINIMNKANSSTLRTDKVFPSHVSKNVKGVVSWVPQDIPEDAISRMIVILGGGHSTSWVTGYDWFAKSGPGAEVRRFVEKIAVKKYEPIRCEAILDELNGKAIFHLPEGDVEYRISKAD